MRVQVGLATAALVCAGTFVAGQAPGGGHLNPMISLHQQKKPLFGLYAPRAFSGRGRGARGATPGAPPAAPATPPPTARTPAELAKDALAYEHSDFLFDGSMEGGVDRGLTQFTDFATALMGAADPATRWKHPLSVKTPKIADDPQKAVENISRQLDAGASTIVFVGVESAEEVRQGLAAMRYKANGGTRPDTAGIAPKYWGLSDAEYRTKADVWPLNPRGELTNWTIVESKEGLAHVREIAAVKGISVLFPGAGTLRQVFSTTDADGKRTLDEAGWEAAIQQVLAACKEFSVPCGYPATENDIEMRMKQGFSVFIMNWGEPGFRAVEIGRKAAGRE